MIHRASFIILTALFILTFLIEKETNVTLLANSEEENRMTIFYDHNKLADLVHQGGKVGESGAYNVWLWAVDGANVQLELAGVKFSLTHTGAATGKLSWIKVGVVEFEKDKEFKANIQIETPHSYFDYRPEMVGQMVLSSDSEFHPAHSLELMRVLGDSPGPVDDKRMTEFRRGDNMTYTFPTYQTKEKWLARAAELRRHILVSNGLWPMPEKTPLNARIFGKIEYDDYTIEKVYFESYPGFFATGNLYRPKGKQGPFPGIINPHGHWGNGRLENSESGSIPGRCINFAKQGYVAFAYDMVGYNDSSQVPHGFREDREALWGINMMGLHLWNSIRSIDFLCALPDVDPERIGCTGASGGGTQTFMVMAVDDRIKVAAPVNMISAHFQGGCNCENAHGLRLDNYNVEIGALMAPRPLLLVSASGDWTTNTPEVEYPDIRSIYKLFDAEEKVHSVQIDAPHNYNKDSREAVYAWFGKWFLGITDESQLKEQTFEVPSKADMLVFQYVSHPAHAVDLHGLIDYRIACAQKQIEALKPIDEAGLKRFRGIMESSLRRVLLAESPGKSNSSNVVADAMGTVEKTGFTVERLLIGREGKGDKIPATLFIPKDAKPGCPGTLVVHADGKAALIDKKNATPGALVSGLLKQGQIVLAVDCFLTGEYNSPFAQTTLNTGDVRYFNTFNRTTLAQRVQDILTGLAYLNGEGKSVSKRNLIGLGEAGLWCLLARGLADDVDVTIVDVTQLDTENDESFMTDLYVPGLRRAGDFRTAATLAAPATLFIHNTGDAFKTDWIADVYKAVGAEDKLTIVKEQVTEVRILKWLAGE